MTKIIGLDLGTTSIGWACVEESENENNLLSAGVRIVSLTADESTNFTKGRSITTNADRTDKRSARRNLFRYKLRREQLINTFIELGFITKETLKNRWALYGVTKENPSPVLELRMKAAKEKVSKEDFVLVLMMINKKRGYKSSRKGNSESENNDENSKEEGDYLAKITERSNSLSKNKQTIGEYLFQNLNEKSLFSTKKEVFYRADYENEFDIIWEKQAQFYPELTEKIKQKVKERIIFYQRPLKSQKGLLSFCEFESEEIKVNINGKIKTKTKGSKVIPKSSPLFQEAKVWQSLNNARITKKDDDSEFELDLKQKKQLFEILNWKESLTASQFLKEIFKLSKEKPSNYTLNLKKVEGNRTNAKLLKAYQEILEVEGYDNIDFKELSIKETLETVKACFETIGIDTEILDFDSALETGKFDKQKSYLLWHLLYSYQEDNSASGLEALYKKLYQKFGFQTSHAKVIANLDFKNDYGNLSAKAIRKILPQLQKGLDYTEACKNVGYNHSNSLTKEERQNQKLEEKLDLLQKNSLRNPVVEKVLNQLIHVVNELTKQDNFGKPDEIRIELSRELKKNADQRKKMTDSLGKLEKEYATLREKLKKEANLKYISRNDLIKYRLYLELEPTGFKTLYSGEYIDLYDLFHTNKYDVEHIIPKSKLFDDSFSNKTLELRHLNKEKDKQTAIDFVEQKYGQKGIEAFKNRIEETFKSKNGIGYAKRQKLLTTEENIPEDFLSRDLGTTAYISKKAVEILSKICNNVTVTSGTITSKLRKDWKLEEVLKELNYDKYEKQGLTHTLKNKDGKKLKRITDWDKRNDHRHHAIDAITVAFTKPAYIQYLNNLHANSRKEASIYGIEKKYMEKDKFGKKRFIAPMPNMREKVKEQLEQVLVSHKAKNKVLTHTINKIKTKNGTFTQKIDTPRGQLHKETIYKKMSEEVVKLEKVSASFDAEKIATVCKPAYRKALENRLKQFDNDPKKAFTGKNSISKNPIYIENTTQDKNESETEKEKVPEKIKTKTYQTTFTTRSQITPDLKLDKVVDKGIKTILQNRLKEYGNDAKKAFSELDKNPIWLNEKAQIPIKSVQISGVNNAEAIRYKTDHKGDFILDENGQKVRTDYIQTGNNHCVIIYEKPDGKLHEEIISFMDAVALKSEGLQIINKEHPKGYKFLCSMKKNELFVFPAEAFKMEDNTLIKPKEIDLLDPKNRKAISKQLFRVQKFTNGDYTFRHHLETLLNDNSKLKDVLWLRGSSAMLKGTVKIRLNHIGQIVEVGE